MSIFEVGARVLLPLAASSVPGVVVGESEPSTFTNRKGVQVFTTRVPVISLRSLPGRDPWHQVSMESSGLLARRSQLVIGLDVDEDGVTPLGLPRLWELQAESLRKYLAARQAQRETTPNIQAEAQARTTGQRRSQPERGPAAAS